MIIIFILFSIFLVTEASYCQEDSYLPVAEVMPSPVGGIKAIYSHIVYPEIAKKNGIKGKVYLLVFVSEKGSVDDVKVVKGIGGGCNEAAISGVNAVKFNPGQSNGKAAKVKLAIAINF
jgi:protein TonB